MIAKLLFLDGDIKVLTPLSYEGFTRINLWSGASDTAYNAFLLKNNLHELKSFTKEALLSADIEFVEEPITLKFDPEGDDSWNRSVQYIPELDEGCVYQLENEFYADAWIKD